MPYSQPAAVDRNIYERVCDVHYGAPTPGSPVQPPQGVMEFHRAPSIQSVESMGSGSVRSGSMNMTDYPRQWGPDRRVGSRENVTGPPPYAHPPNMKTPNGIHYRQGSTDSGSHHRGESGNHGNQSIYHSPDSGDSGFLSHPPSEVDGRAGSTAQGHVYSEIGRWVTSWWAALPVVLPKECGTQDSTAVWGVSCVSMWGVSCVSRWGVSCVSASLTSASHDHHMQAVGTAAGLPTSPDCPL